MPAKKKGAGIALNALGGGGGAPGGGGGTGSPLGGLGGGGGATAADLVTLGLGGAQLIGSVIKKGKVQEPSAEDPEQRSVLNELRRERKKLQTGTAFNQQRRALRQSQQVTQRAILRRSGGAAGAAIAGLTRAQQATGTGLAQIGAQGQQAQQAILGLEVQQQAAISQRKLELGLLRRAQGLAEAAQLRKEGFANVLAGSEPFLSSISLGQGGGSAGTGPDAPAAAPIIPAGSVEPRIPPSTQLPTR